MQITNQVAHEARVSRMQAGQRTIAVHLPITRCACEPVCAANTLRTRSCAPFAGHAGFSSACQDLLFRCLRVEPEQRLTLVNLLDNDWIKHGGQPLVPRPPPRCGAHSVSLSIAPSASSADASDADASDADANTRRSSPPPSASSTCSHSRSDFNFTATASPSGAGGSHSAPHSASTSPTGAGADSMRATPQLQLRVQSSNTHRVLKPVAMSRRPLAAGEQSQSSSASNSSSSTQTLVSQRLSPPTVHSPMSVAEAARLRSDSGIDQCERSASASASVSASACAAATGARRHDRVLATEQSSTSCDTAFVETDVEMSEAVEATEDMFLSSTDSASATPFAVDECVSACLPQQQQQQQPPQAQQPAEQQQEDTSVCMDDSPIELQPAASPPRVARGRAVPQPQCPAPSPSAFHVKSSTFPLTGRSASRLCAAANSRQPAANQQQQSPPQCSTLPSASCGSGKHGKSRSSVVTMPVADADARDALFAIPGSPVSIKPAVLKLAADKPLRSSRFAASKSMSCNPSDAAAAAAMLCAPTAQAAATCFGNGPIRVLPAGAVAPPTYAYAPLATQLSDECAVAPMAAAQYRPMCACSGCVTLSGQRLLQQRCRCGATLVGGIATGSPPPYPSLHLCATCCCSPLSRSPNSLHMNVNMSANVNGGCGGTGVHPLVQQLSVKRPSGSESEFSTCTLSSHESSYYCSGSDEDGIGANSDNF